MAQVMESKRLRDVFLKLLQEEKGAQYTSQTFWITDSILQSFRSTGSFFLLPRFYSKEQKNNQKIYWAGKRKNFCQATLIPDGNKIKVHGELVELFFFGGASEVDSRTISTNILKTILNSREYLSSSFEIYISTAFKREKLFFITGWKSCTRDKEL